MILILATAAIAKPAPAAAPADPCGGAHTHLLAALDRPSIGFSACPAKRGETIVEAGYENALSGTAATAVYPQGLLRFGVAHGLELDAIAGGRFDSGFGAKYRFWHDAQRALAADFLYTAPTGTAAFTAGAPTQTLNLDYSTPIAGPFGLGVTAGAQSGFAASRSGAGSRFFSLLPSFVVSDQWSPRAQAFIETFGQTRTRPDGGALFGMDAAVQYLPVPQFEIDVEAGRTVTDLARSHFIGFGFGARF